MTSKKATHLTWHRRTVTRDQIAELNGHRGATVWLTGLSAAGKSTLANVSSKALLELGVRAFVLDGDNVRHGLTRDLGFTPDDRTENIRRIGEVAKLMTEAGMINFSAFISPYREDRSVAREMQEPGDFIEVHVDCSLEECERRDPKGIYEKARQGLVRDFTGVSAPYEPPDRPEVYINTETMTVEACVETIITALVDRGIIGRVVDHEGSVELKRSKPRGEGC